MCLHAIPNNIKCKLRENRAYFSLNFPNTHTATNRCRQNRKPKKRKPIETTFRPDKKHATTKKHEAWRNTRKFSAFTIKNGFFSLSFSLSIYLSVLCKNCRCRCWHTRNELIWRTEFVRQLVMANFSLMYPIYFSDCAIFRLLFCLILCVFFSILFSTAFPKRTNWLLHSWASRQTNNNSKHLLVLVSQFLCSSFFEFLERISAISQF